MAIFKGAGVAIVTPMYEDGKVNYDKLEELLEYQIANSTDAIHDTWRASQNYQICN
jgi:4-hydroxy-tetrahydrodipicolinate synthase